MESAHGMGRKYQQDEHGLPSGCAWSIARSWNISKGMEYQINILADKRMYFHHKTQLFTCHCIPTENGAQVLLYVGKGNGNTRWITQEKSYQ